MEMVEWFRWRIRKRKRTTLQERSSIPDIRIIKCSTTGWKRFTEAQNMLRKQFPGLTGKNWKEKIIGEEKK